MTATRGTVRPGGERSPLRIRLSADRPDGVIVVRVSGSIAGDDCPTLDHFLHTKVPWRTGHVVMDLSGVTLLSAAGIRVLTRYANRLNQRGRGFSLVAVSEQVRRTLEVAWADAMFKIYDSVSLAAAGHSSLPTPQVTPDPPQDQNDRLVTALDQVLRLRAATYTKPVIARAVGVIQGRYGIDDADHALRLLGQCAKNHHLPLVLLARTLLATPAPTGTGSWLPDRPHRTEPLLTFYVRPAAHHANRIAVVAAFLDTAVKYMATTMGAVHVADPLGDGLCLGQHQGLPDSLAFHLVDPEDGHQVALAARAGRTRITIPDIADTTTSTQVPEQTARLLIRLGIHALQCTPLLTPEGHCAGTITTYHRDSGHTASELAYARLDQAATELADWLEWHQATIAREALEQLHQRATDTRVR
ncbi:STAS domain-containing protein [Actinocrispum sp. NPDC049592]|uniref:STAS domain-containing protein n=1 Tax=Actinocrispum sp. NPDC049592 TaxID=3154835 RepID=UPI0034375714